MEMVSAWLFFEKDLQIIELMRFVLQWHLANVFVVALLCAVAAVVLFELFVPGFFGVLQVVHVPKSDSPSQLPALGKNLLMWQI